MGIFDCIVAVGDSWTWGAELEDSLRLTQRFSHLLAVKYDVPEFNIARCAATNACYKWHWLDWLDTHGSSFSRPLVIVNVTGADRWLLHDNQQDFWQNFPDMLVSEAYVAKFWSNQPNGGGYFRSQSIDVPYPTNVQINKAWLAQIQNRRMSEINAIWELKMLDNLVADSGGLAIVWNAFYAFESAQLVWVNSLKWHGRILDHWQPMPSLRVHDRDYFAKAAHPNWQGHEIIAKRLQHSIDFLA